MNSYRRSKHKSLLIKFLCHLTTFVLAIYMASKSSNFNETMAWFLVMFFMCRIIILECFKRYLLSKREEYYFERLRNFNKDKEDDNYFEGLNK